MFTSLNNEIAKRIITYALDGKYRFCAYGLYNHHDLTFDESTYNRLFCYVMDFLGTKAPCIFEDDSIDACVRIFIIRKYNELCSHD